MTKPLDQKTPHLRFTLTLHHQNLCPINLRKRNNLLELHFIHFCFFSFLSTGVMNIKKLFESIQRQLKKNSSGGPVIGPQTVTVSSRYILSNQDPNIQVPDFEKWMTQLESHVDRHLYEDGSKKPAVNFIKVEIRNFTGVAYTVNRNGGKLISVSTNHLKKFNGDARSYELTGVVLHEMVHALEYNGKGTAPVGLIEGIADFVRLKSGYPANGWRRDYSSPLRGYSTTAYFLDYLDSSYPRFVKRLNTELRERYNDRLWNKLTGKSLTDLWQDYKNTKF